MKKTSITLGIIVLTILASSVNAQQKKDSINIKRWVTCNPAAIIISEIDFKKKPAPIQAQLLQDPKLIVYKTALTQKDILDYISRNR